MKRILTWHFPMGSASNQAQAYYVEDDYTYSAVRIHADTAPIVSDAEFEILKDGVSIMNNRDNVQYNLTSGVVTSHTISTTVILAQGSTSEELGGDFAEDNLESGSWLTCTMSKDGGGKNFTVQLELDQISEEESEE